jgi:hypothetical protein
MSGAAWRTLVDPKSCVAYGVGGLHLVFFGPADDQNGPAPAVTVQIPECSMSMVNAAMAFARSRRADVCFVCDTLEQANSIAARAVHLLPRHKRVSYERAGAGAWGQSS